MWIQSGKKSRKQRSEIRGRKSEKTSEVAADANQLSKDLNVYKAAYDLAMRIFGVSKTSSARGEICFNESDSPIIAFGMPKFT
jgi:hypothetical protein